MRFPFLRTRVFQVTILALLLVSAAQVFWWIVDQSRKTANYRRSLTLLYDQDAAAARELRSLGADAATLERLYPHLDIDSSGEITVSPAALESLREDRARWLNQYGWEGGFFLVVLTLSMAAVWRALHEEAILRRRQQNFIAAVSHELKSPLTSMQLSVETLNLRKPSPERLSELADRMAADINRMKDMVGKILEASRFDQRRIHLYPEELELRTILCQALDELDNLRRRSSVELQIEVDPGLKVWADPTGVRSVLRNLLDNAIRSVAANEGGFVRVLAKPAGDFVRLTIEDGGVGFDPAESKQLFDKFYRPGNEMRRKGAGQGLGLYIVRRYIELSQGRVRAHSDGPGKGAKFEVWWPAAVETVA